MSKKIKEALKGFPVSLSIEVQWGDMDAAQHVNNTVYLKWAENSRIAYFDALGYDVIPKENQAGLILAWMDCKYIFPVSYPDTIFTGVKVNSIENDRFVMESHFFSQKHQRIIAISKQRVVTYNYAKLQKMDLPASLHQAIINLEKKNRI